jgi:hypothetical protein
MALHFKTTPRSYAAQTLTQVSLYYYYKPLGLPKGKLLPMYEAIIINPI